MASPTPPNDVASAPEEFPQTTPPRDLHATSDIRFVMRETAALSERVDNLKATVEKLGPLIEKALDRYGADIKERLGDFKSNLKETDEKVSDMEKKIAFVKGATWVLGGLFAVALVVLAAIARKLFG